MLDVRGALPRLQVHHRAKRFQLQKVWVGEKFEVAAVHWILLSRLPRCSFQKDVVSAHVNGPLRGVEESRHLFRKAPSRFFVPKQLEEILPNYAARIGKISERPECQRTDGLKMILVHRGSRREGKNRAAAR